MLLMVAYHLIPKGVRIIGMAKGSISIKELIKDAFSGVGPLGWVFILPVNKGIELLAEVDYSKLTAAPLVDF
jgi:hypothetical protein